MLGLVYEVLLLQAELKVKLVLEDLVPSIEKFPKLDSVLELIPGLHVGDGEGQFVDGLLDF